MYFDRILLTALGSPQVKRVEQVRREHDATGRIGFMRYRLTLINADLLELTERVEVQAGEIVVTKYRHHWQNQEGILIKRWDNAPHYPQVASFPPSPRRLRGQCGGASASGCTAGFASGPGGELNHAGFANCIASAMVSGVNLLCALTEYMFCCPSCC